MEAIPLSTMPAQRALAVLLAGVLLLTGCVAPSGSAGGGGSTTAPAGDVAQAAVARESAPAVADDDLAALAAGNRAFALDMYKAIRQQAGNLFFSPYSISQALAMTYAGARGATEQEMASTLRFDLPQARLHPAFNALDRALISHSQVGASKPNPAQAPSEKPSGLELTTANALWAQQGLPIREAFLNTLARNYGSGVRLLNFAESEQARQDINMWVSDQTKQRIEDLLPEGSITPDTALVLTNAIYFKASWAERFVSQRTADDSFKLLDGSQITTPMMHNVSTYGQGAGSGYLAVELPYYGQTTSMVIVMPDAGQFAEFETGLTTERLDAILAGLQPAMIDLKMPKFEIKGQTISLAEALRSLGMKAAFDKNLADFSGIVADPRLWIDDVMHQAFVAVDEQGTEAAAATAVVMETSLVRATDEVIIDHPFLFLIRDRETGTILFMGRMVDPRG
jgi:serpin B